MKSKMFGNVALLLALSILWGVIACSEKTTAGATVDDNSVAEILYSPSGAVSFVIPHDYVVEGKLNLKFVQDEDSGDAAFQETALSLYDITIVNTEEAFHSDHQYAAHTILK